MARRLIILLALMCLVAPASAGAKQLTRYEAGGGIAGRYDKLLIATDGGAHQTGDGGEHHFTVSAQRLRGLKSALKAARFKTLKRSYEPKGQVFDGITQTVRYRGRSVSVSSGAELPPRLAKVINRLGRILRYR